MTTKTLTQNIQMQALVEQRQRALAEAEQTRQDSRNEAHRVFVTGVKQLMQDTGMSVTAAAEKAGLSRGVMHDLIRHHGGE